jgi:hypothetical protein
MLVRVGPAEENSRSPANTRSRGDQIMERTPHGAPEVTRTEARQGFLDRPVLVILTVSLALVIVAFLVLPSLV